MENKYDCDAYDNGYCYCLGRPLTDEEVASCEDECCAYDKEEMKTVLCPSGQQVTKETDMKIKKEIITRTYRKDDILVETVKQYHYANAEERANHLIKMEQDGYKDSGQVQDNVGSDMKPEYVWFGSYYKIEPEQIK